jgi:CheY-like chemotaxis protein
MFSALLVEDNATFREMLSGLVLARFPAIGVEESHDGEDALSKMQSLRPDIVIMDIRLPGENGLEVTRRIRQMYEQTVIVIVTGHDLPEYRQVAFRNGADCFLSKGSEAFIEDILARIEGAMSRKRQ